MGRLCGCGRGTKEGVGLVPLMISEVRRNRGAFDVEDPGVHHLTVNLHHHFIVLPIDHVICRADTGLDSQQGASHRYTFKHGQEFISSFLRSSSPRVFCGSVRAVPLPPSVETETPES